MPDGSSIINLGELAKPATVLVEKISDAVGGVFAPYQIKRMAKANAEANLISAKGQIELTDLHRRAMHRFVEEEAKKQENIEAITEKAIPQLEDKSQPQNMEDDWVTHFFDKCRIVSDAEMQMLWAKVLAGEANAPGTFAKRTVDFLGLLDKKDAELFYQLCGFGWMIGNVVPLVYDVRASIYNEHGINFDALRHLDSIGLVTFASPVGYRRVKLPKRLPVFYYGECFLIEFANDSDNEMEIGRVMLTQVGQQLAPICRAEPRPGFIEYILKKWTSTGHLIACPYPRVQK